MTDADAPVSTVPPCDDTFDLRIIHDPCRDCGHVLAVHGWDYVCSVCDAVAALRLELEARP